MKNTVRTKKLRNGDKLVVVNIDRRFEYAPKYVDLKRLIAHLGAIYGSEEVTRELGLGKTTLFPKKSEDWKKRWKYKYLGQIIMDGYKEKDLKKLVSESNDNVIILREISYSNNTFRLCWVEGSKEKGTCHCTRRLKSDKYKEILSEYKKLLKF